MVYRLLTAACVALASTGIFILAAETRADDPPPPTQNDDKPKTDEATPPPTKSDTAKSDGSTPAASKKHKKKSGDSTPATQPGDDGTTPDGTTPSPQSNDGTTPDPTAADPTAADTTTADPQADEATSPDPTPPPTPTGIEVQTRGPVHEAFAEPQSSQPVASPIIQKAPPNPIAEQAPDQKPTGQNSIWIPGYWSFDDEKKDYLWVSGIWRVPPPGRVWMPGHWQNVQGGSQWVGGFWSLPNQEQLNYLPTPPSPLDAGPSSPAPEPGLDYAPGCWVHSGTRFLWRPGFWHRHCSGWIWTPATYVWTPAGCVFVEGYWDHPLQLRGLLFAPVTLDGAMISSQSFHYTPAFVLNMNFLAGALFARPSCHRYYFGDYFGSKYSQAGYVPWIDYRANRMTPDPLFDYYRAEGGLGRHDAGWARKLHQLYAGRSNGSIPRPPRTLTAQIQAARKIVSNKGNTGKKAISGDSATNMTAVTHLSRMTGRPSAGNNSRLEQVSATQRAQVQRTTTQYRDFARERTQGEARLSASVAAPTHLGSSTATMIRPKTGAPVVLAKQVSNSGEPRTVAARTMKLQWPHEIVKASTASSATSARPNGRALRKQPPLPTMPRPQPHTDASRPKRTGSP
jgi:hypothetical protein